jgi:hypothetical protein
MTTLYKAHYSGNCVIRNSDGALIPFDARNSDYIKYVEWLNTGKQPEEADPSPFLQAQQPPEPPTKDELLAKLLEIQEQIAQLS